MAVTQTKHGLPEPRNWPIWLRLALVVGLAILYVLAFVLLRSLLGGGVSALVLLPVSAAGWLFGLPGGLIASVALLVPTVVLNLAVDTDLGRVLLGGLAGFVTTVLTGVVVGWLSDLRELLRRELSERRRVEEEREKLLASEQEQRALAETLTDVVLTLTSQTSHQAALEEILYQAHRIVRYDVASIALLEGDTLRTVHWRVAEGVVDRELSGTSPALAVDREAVQFRWPIVVPDVQHEERWVAARGTEWIRSYLSVPLCLGRRVLGVLRLNGGAPDQFSSQDAQRLLPLASAAAIAVENACLVEELEKEVVARMADFVAEHQKSETILRSVDDAIALSDLEGRIEYVNDAYTTLTGYTLEEVEGRHVDFLAAEAVPEHIRQARHVVLERGEIWRGEATLRRRDGRTYDAEISFAPVYDARDLLTGHVSSHRDISQRKSLERARNQFITNVSHQLRTPVTTIQLYAHLLRREGLPEKAKESFRIIEGEAVRLVGLIEDVLAMATFESGQVIDTWRPVSIPAIVEEVVSLYREQARASGLALEATSRSPDGLIVVGDQARLAQALGEIVENALTFTPVDGRVSVHAEPIDDQGEAWVKIVVRDTGPGIPEEEQEKVFERFFRGRIVESGNVPGTGLGLSIAQEIVRAHGGRVTLESKVGDGSSFTIWLPRGMSEE
jgi:two-component system phosphate regulon sensor histidine kinase PhoR